MAQYTETILGNMECFIRGVFFHMKYKESEIIKQNLCLPKTWEKNVIDS